MNLLFCVKGLHKSSGGAERILTNIANGLASRGHMVKVLSYDSPGKDSFYNLDPAIDWIQLGIGLTEKPTTFSSTLLRILSLRKKIIKIKPDLAIGFMHSMFIPLGIALSGSGIPVIASEHIVPEHYKTRKLENLLLQLSPFFVEQFTCVSQQVRDLYPRRIRDKMIAIPNPVTVTTDKKANVVGKSQKRRTLLTVGRLEDQKDHTTLIQAFYALADIFPDWDLRIIGEGSLLDPLEKLVLDLGIKDRVQFPGTTKDISPEYLKAQLFVLPSLYESFGLTLVEAFAHGLPAIGFEDCPGINTLIKPGFNGLLAKADKHRSTSLARSLHTLMKDETARVSLAQNTRTIAEDYTLEPILDQWETMFSKISSDELLMRNLHAKNV